MKTVRQVAILDIIEKQEIETQEELARALNARGIRVTQATVSRDIKELRLLKVLTPSGKYKYATGDQADNNLTDRFIRMLAESLLSVSSANNLIVVKTLSRFGERRSGKGQDALAGGAGDAGVGRQHGAADYPLERGDNHRHQPHPGNDEITAMVIPGTEKEYPS